MLLGVPQAANVSALSKVFPIKSASHTEDIDPMKSMSRFYMLDQDVLKGTADATIGLISELSRLKGEGAFLSEIRLGSTRTCVEELKLPVGILLQPSVYVFDGLKTILPDH